MNLDNWGWSPFFARQVKPWRQKGYLPGRIIRGEKNYFRVLCAEGELTARFTGKMRHGAGTRADLPVVGDWVVVKPQPGGRGMIYGILDRKSSFARNLPGRRKGKGGGRIEQQVIAANVDLVLIVSGLDRDFNLRRIERYLTLVVGSGAEGIVVLNKADLCDNPQQCLEQVKDIAPNTPVYSCMARDSQQLEFLLPHLQPGRTLALLGSSGVGKSTILNGLLGEERQKIGEVSHADGKGRHTTTHRELFQLPQGGILIDNPGMRELHLWGDEEDLSESFAEVEELGKRCKFNDCRHLAEPGCAVLSAVENGEITPERLHSYHKLKEELGSLQRRR